MDYAPEWLNIGILLYEMTILVGRESREAGWGEVLKRLRSTSPVATRHHIANESGERFGKCTII